jgi:hypothetical protein
MGILKMLGAGKWAGERGAQALEGRIARSTASRAERAVERDLIASSKKVSSESINPEALSPELQGRIDASATARRNRMIKRDVETARSNNKGVIFNKNGEPIYASKNWSPKQRHNYTDETISMFDSNGNVASSPTRETGRQMSLFKQPYKIKNGKLSVKTNPVNSAIGNEESMKKWMPTVIGATILGGGLVSYLDSRKHGRSNSELYSG